MEYNDQSPNKPKVNPENLFTHTSLVGVILWRKKFTTALKINHQVAEPVNTPNTIAMAEK